MASRFTQQEIKMLKENPNVKAVRENRLTLTYEFRLLLWQQWKSKGLLKSVFVQNGFDMQIIDMSHIYSIITNFEKRDKPSGGTNRIFGVNESRKYTNTQAEVKSLLNSGLFIKARNGIAFHPDFIEEIYHQYPDISIENILLSKGIQPNIVGYRRIYHLKQHLTEHTPYKQVELYDASVINKLIHHPYIKRISKKQIVFHEQFYRETSHLSSLHIDNILNIFEIDYHLIPIQTRNRLKCQMSNRKDKPCEKISTDDIELLYRIEHNKHQAMMDMIEIAFTQCRECVPYLNCQNRKSLCVLIQKMPEDEEWIYTKRAILNKVGISKTSYYAILQNKSYGMREQKQEEQDEKDIKSIKRVIDYKGYPKGSRQITMMMPRLSENKFSRGKIIRLMRKGKLTCKVRKGNAQKRASKETLERNTKPNKLKRKFRLERPLKNVLTDVSYLKYGKGLTAYLSCLKDASSGKILGFIVSDRNDAQLVDNTIGELRKHTLDAQCLLHSDQGVLYLSPYFQQYVVEMGLSQSMSRRGNCWDNASQESFFGHFKDECDYHSCTCVEEVTCMVETYMDYYNNKRPQWTRNKMTPQEFETYLLTMSEVDFKEYRGKEKQKYEQMMKEAGNKARKRAIDIGIRDH